MFEQLYLNLFGGQEQNFTLKEQCNFLELEACHCLIFSIVAEKSDIKVKA